MTDWPRVLDDAYGGDPFRKLIESDGQFYVLDEAALIENEERLLQSMDLEFRTGGWLTDPSP